MQSFKNSNNVSVNNRDPSLHPPFTLYAAVSKMEDFLLGRGVCSERVKTLIDENVSIFGR